MILLPDLFFWAGKIIFSFVEHHNLFPTVEIRLLWEKINDLV